MTESRPVMHMLLTLLLAATTAAPAASSSLALACGDVTDRQIVLWAQAEAAGTITIELDDDPAFPSPRTVVLGVDAATDFAGQKRLDGLASGTAYHLRARAGEARASGRCTTAPAAARSGPVRFIIGGDVGGQGWCRDRADGYRIFASIEGRQPDFFIANGDMIYADGTCPPIGPDGAPNVPGAFPGVADPAVDWTDARAVRAVIDAHWRYNRADPHLRAFLATTPVFAQWDDHEVINDFGAGRDRWPAAPSRAGFRTLAAEGWASFRAQNPLAMADGKLYRSVRWGRDLELFLIDGRTFRAANDAADRPGKSLLGDQQRTWLIEGLRASRATWKVVSSNIPLAVPTGSQPDRYGRDGFANGMADGFSSRTGFEHELLEVLRAIEGRVDNLVFVATDVHLAASLRHRVDLDGDGVFFVFHELISGPLRAGTLPTLPRLDPTLRPTILFSEGDLFNFGEIEILPGGTDRPGRLIYTVRDTDGETRPGSRLVLRPAPPSARDRAARGRAARDRAVSDR